MRLPKDSSGDELIQLLERAWDYRVLHQRAATSSWRPKNPSHHRIAVPRHKALRVGTLNAILRAVARHKGVERGDVEGDVHAYLLQLELDAKDARDAMDAYTDSLPEDDEVPA